MGRTSCQVGAWREGTQIGHNRSIHDHVRYGGGESVFVCFSSESSVMPTYCFVSFHLVVLVSHSKVFCLNFFLTLSFSWEMLQGYFSNVTQALILRTRWEASLRMPNRCILRSSQRLIRPATSRYLAECSKNMMQFLHGNILFRVFTSSYTGYITYHI